MSSIVEYDIQTQFQRNAYAYRTRKINVVLIGGKAGAGKTVLAGYLTGKVQIEYAGLSVTHQSLAYPIKELAHKSFYWDGKKNEGGRRLLQELGDTGRNYNENIWVRQLEESLTHGFQPVNMAFIDDWRFPNEKSYFEDNFMYDVITVRIERLSTLDGCLANHVSEVSLPAAEKESLVYNKDSLYNFSITNDGDIKDLYEKADSVFSYLINNIVKY